jgi:HK97 family phage major capsid protein
LDFTKYAKALMATQGRRDDALALAVGRGASSRLKAMLETPISVGEISDKILLKAPVAIGSVGGSTWGDELAPFRESSAAFVQSLAPFSAFDRIMSDGGFTRMPLRTRISIASTAAIGSSLSELAPKPISQMSFAQEYLTAYKAVALLVISDELAMSTAPGANDLFANQLRAAVALATDTQFLSILGDSTGVASNPSSGLAAAQLLADLSTALQAIEVGVNSKLYLIVPTSVAKTIPILRDNGGMLVVNGQIGNVRVVPTSASTSDGVLLDASAIAADSDLVTTDVVRNATLRMDDNPTSGSYQLVSLWQNNLQAMRAERFFGATVLRSDGIALISNMVTA